MSIRRARSSAGCPADNVLDPTRVVRAYFSRPAARPEQLDEFAPAEEAFELVEDGIIGERSSKS